ncbi:unnamed protein product [Malus baccata var. baccata]
MEMIASAIFSASTICLTVEKEIKKKKCRMALGHLMPSTKMKKPIGRKFGCLHDHIPLHSYIHINGYGSFLGFRGTNRGSRAAVAGGSASASAKKLAVNGYAGPSSSTSRLTYNWTDFCLVIPPPAGKKPRAIIKFLGGAFIGAVPELTYSYLTELLPKDGFLVISVPYNVTFDHVQASRQVYESNGALLQVLAGSYFSDKVPKLELCYRTIRKLLSSVTKFVDQLPSVLNEVAQGISEFKPTPSENRDFFKSSYNVKHTLLVKFNFDAIDETDTLEETLKPRVESIGGTLEKVEISGNHITPCGQEPKWQAGYVYTPADAIAQSLKTLSLNDLGHQERSVSSFIGVGLDGTNMVYKTELDPLRGNPLGSSDRC